MYKRQGIVIEAKGTAYGVVKSKIGSGWTHWGELKGVDYAEKGEQIAMSETKLAVVTTASGSLNMRKTASKSAEVLSLIHICDGRREPSYDASLHGWSVRPDSDTVAGCEELRALQV